MRKEELIERIKGAKEFYEMRNEMAHERVLTSKSNIEAYADWWYEGAVITFTEMIIRDLQELIDEIEAPF